jgi:hypothetical protein
MKTMKATNPTAILGIDVLLMVLAVLVLCAA